MMQAAAIAQFASHVAGLRGPLLAVMTGSDNVAPHLRLGGDGLAQVCHSQYYGVSARLPMPQRQTALTAILCPAGAGPALGSVSADRGTTTASSRRASGAATRSYQIAHPPRAVIPQEAPRQLGGVVEAREGVACGSCRCGGFSPAWVVTARPASAADSARTCPLCLPGLVVLYTLCSINPMCLSVMLRGQYQTFTPSSRVLRDVKKRV